MSEAQSDIDLLMARVDEINSKLAPEITDNDASVIIAYHRLMRKRLASGEKPVRAGPVVDLDSLLDLAPVKASGPVITRRL